MSAPCWLVRLGCVAYGEAWELQRRLVSARVAGEIPDVLILVEHPHVYTLGRGGHPENVLLDEAALAAVGAEVVWVDRGGDVTYHGPGQLVGYPIVDLQRLGKDVHQHLRRIEETLIRALADFGLEGRRDRAYTGVWVGPDEAPEKVAAIGVRVSRWVTSHGFALNVDPDLRYFGHIIPCGIRQRGVTSLAKLLNRPVGREEAEEAVLRHFAEVFDVDVTSIAGYQSRLRPATFTLESAYGSVAPLNRPEDFQAMIRQAMEDHADEVQRSR
jgi:lipoyl(octanoyl) transferase